MQLLAGLVIGMLGLMLGEVVILVWFCIKAFGLSQGKTEFNIPWYVPIFYIVYMLPICMIIFNLEYGLWGEGDFIPVATRLSNAARIFLLVNLSTPLFPILAYLKHHRIKSIKKKVPATEVPENS